MPKKRTFTVEEFFPHHDDYGAYRDIVRLDKTCFPSDERFLPERGFFWMAFEEDKPMPVGYCGLEVTKLGKQKFGYLSRACVVKTARGNGLQNRFIQTRIDRAKEQECKFVISNTYENVVSGNNLINAGFRLYNPKKAILADGTCYWRLDL